jgi:hypothetical protein
LNKQFVGTYEGRDFYSVDTSAIRSIAQPDEEFGNFATEEEFPDLIPEGQVWLGEKTLDKEGIFFIANALTRMKEKEEGASEDKAYEAGIKIEQALREKITGLTFRDGKPHRRVPSSLYVKKRYITLQDVEFPIDVWIVDGSTVRS